MTIKDFHRMPVGIFYAKDAVYEYKLNKTINKDGLFHISISLKGNIWGPTMSITQLNESYFENYWDKMRYGDPKYIAASFSSGVGMLFFSSTDTPYYLWELTLLPSGSFKNYSVQEITQSQGVLAGQ